MTKLGSLPAGAANDPKAPFNESEKQWFELFNEEQPPRCYGCDSEEVEYYEPVRSGQYYFYCARCIMEAWKDSPWSRFDLFSEDNNIFPIR